MNDYANRSMHRSLYLNRISKGDNIESHDIYPRTSSRSRKICCLLRDDRSFRYHRAGFPESHETIPEIDEICDPRRCLYGMYIRRYPIEISDDPRPRLHENDVLRY